MNFIVIMLVRKTAVSNSPAASRIASGTGAFLATTRQGMLFEKSERRRSRRSAALRLLR